ncbi:MAG: EpsI family protein [Deltaproteobacteria bacterium]|nr:EpsI family protein [Deltaproteobacteria bacterium]MBW1939237.1 EpsI family protein [Deltaproteobacteria bacterium]
MPLEFGQWQGKDIPLDERIYEILETRSIINRTYREENGKKVLLSIVYYPETKVDFHAPEACLEGRGIQISKSYQTITITPNEKKVKINLNRLIRKQGGSDELIYYFYKAGDFLGKNYIKLRLNLALNKFGRKEKNGSLIRVSTPVFGEDYKSASNTLTRIIGRSVPISEQISIVSLRSLRPQATQGSGREERISLTELTELTEF